MKPDEAQSLEEFREQCRRQMERPLALPHQVWFLSCSQAGVGRPPWRAFDTMAEYRAWCEANLPDYLGYKRAE